MSKVSNLSLAAFFNTKGKGKPKTTVKVNDGTTAAPITLSVPGKPDVSAGNVRERIAEVFERAGKGKVRGAMKLDDDAADNVEGETITDTFDGADAGPQLRRAYGIKPADETDGTDEKKKPRNRLNGVHKPEGSAAE
jgi:hypothetical protein